jgi:O-antigen/teichoic acid export membrane protein
LNIKKNIIANFAGKFWSLVSVFIFVPLYIDLLGFDSYAVISFSLLLSGIMAVFDAGLTATLSREFARSDRSSEEKKRVFFTLETLYLLLSLVIGSTLFFSAGFIASNFIKSSIFTPDTLTLFIQIMGGEIVFQMLFRFYLGGIFGLELHGVANLFQITWGVFRNGLVLVLLVFMPSLHVFFLWQMAISIAFAVLVKLKLHLQISGTFSQFFNLRINWVIWKETWRFTIGMMLISLVAALSTQLDKLIITKLLPLENLGYYTLAVSLASGLVMFVSPISTTLVPRLTALYSNGERDKAAHMFGVVNQAVVVLISSVAASMMTNSGHLIWAWTGRSDLLAQVPSILMIASLSYAMLSLTMLPYSVAIANGFTKLNNQLGIASLIVTIPGYCWAIPAFGMLGAAACFCIVQSAIAIVYYYFINKMYFGISTFNLFAKTLFFPFFVSGAVAWLLSLFPVYSGSNRLMVFLWVGIVTLVIFGVTFLIVFNKHSRGQLLDILNTAKTA